MAIEDLRKALGISGSKMYLGEFNQEFFEALSEIWSGALEQQLTAEDCAILFMAPFIASNLKKYQVEIGVETTGYYFAVDTQVMPEN